MKPEQTSKPRPSANHPWQMLVVALLFFVPGIGMLLSSTPVIAYRQSYRGVLPGYIEIASPAMLHGCGVAVLLMAVAILLFYLRLCKAIERDAKMPRRRRRQ